MSIQFIINVINNIKKLKKNTVLESAHEITLDWRRSL